MLTRKKPEKFLVAFSFAGEQRAIVRVIAEVVEQRLGWGTVFLDEWFEGELVGSAADLKLQKIYSEESDVVVFCASKEYDEKKWTKAEWDAIRARHIKLRAEANRRAADRIVPLRVADGDVEGLLDNAIWVDARQRSTKYVADLIVQRLRAIVPNVGKPPVFLAETTPDLEDDSEIVSRPRFKTFLEEQCGCVVLPDSTLVDLPPDEYRIALGTSMQRSIAFVQLLSRYPWKGGGFDKAQYRIAEDSGVTMFRFRGDIKIDHVKRNDPKHAEFLELSGAIAGSFEDFKRYVWEKLGALAGEKERQIARLQDQERQFRLGIVPSNEDKTLPLVRVAIRAGQEKKVWRKMFQVAYEKLKLRLDELPPDKSFIEVQATDPCDGFVILCDGQSLSDKTFSPRELLAQCRQIQTSEKNETLRPPVAVVFWPPPKVNWPELLRSTPKPLYTVLGNSLEAGLREFVEDILKMRRR